MTLSVEEYEIIDRWCAEANNAAAYVVDDLELLTGKPWDNPHFIKTFRRVGPELDLAVSWMAGRQTTGRVSSIAAVVESEHAWGRCLELKGPLHWRGSQTCPPSGFSSILGLVFKSFAEPRCTPANFKYQRLFIISLCRN